MGGMFKFVHAGAGFTRPNARIHARVAIDKIDGTGAGVSINGHWFMFDEFPAASATDPPETGQAHKLGVMTALRSWRATMKAYDYQVESDGEMVLLPERQTLYRSGSPGTHTCRIPALVVTKKDTILALPYLLVTIQKRMGVKSDRFDPDPVRRPDKNP